MYGGYIQVCRHDAGDAVLPKRVSAAGFEGNAPVLHFLAGCTGQGAKIL